MDIVIDDGGARPGPGGDGAGLPPPRMPDCLKCARFRVTWDPAFPRACDAFGVKSRRMPAEEVLLATGMNCPAFELKEGLK